MDENISVGMNQDNLSKISDGHTPKQERSGSRGLFTRPVNKWVTDAVSMTTHSWLGRH